MLVRKPPERGPDEQRTEVVAEENEHAHHPGDELHPDPIQAEPFHPAGEIGDGPRSLKKRDGHPDEQFQQKDPGEGGGSQGVLEQLRKPQQALTGSQHAHQTGGGQREHRVAGGKRQNDGDGCGKQRYHPRVCDVFHPDPPGKPLAR